MTAVAATVALADVLTIQMQIILIFQKLKRSQNDISLTEIFVSEFLMLRASRDHQHLQISAKFQHESLEFLPSFWAL